MPEPIHLQPRDFELLKGLFESRTMSSKHTVVLYFDGKKEASKKRLQKLKSAGMIADERPRLYEPARLRLTPKGFRALRENGLLCDYPVITEVQFKRRSSVSNFTLKHELAVMDAKTAIVGAVQKIASLTVAEFTTWPILCQFKVLERGKREPTLLKPDGFLRIHEEEANGSLSEHAFFLEVDRGTETLETLLKKAVCYNLFYRTGGFAKRNGGLDSQFKEYPFRVLMVLKSDARIKNVENLLRENKPPIVSQVVLVKMADFLKNPLSDMI